MVRFVIRFSLKDDQQRYEMPCETAAELMRYVREISGGGHHIERIIDLGAGCKMVTGDEAM